MTANTLQIIYWACLIRVKGGEDLEVVLESYKNLTPEQKTVLRNKIEL